MFSYVVNGIKLKITAEFRASRRLRFEDTKIIMSTKYARKVSGLSSNRPQESNPVQSDVFPRLKRAFSIYLAFWLAHFHFPVCCDWSTENWARELLNGSEFKKETPTSTSSLCCWTFSLEMFSSSKLNVGDLSSVSVSVIHWFLSARSLCKWCSFISIPSNCKRNQSTHRTIQSS